MLVRGERIVAQYQSLMCTGAWIPGPIERLTGISNAMVRTAPPAEQVMREIGEFTRGCALVAHQAAFDRAFWIAEGTRCSDRWDTSPAFACTVLLSRRLYPQADNHRLGTLARLHGLPMGARAHRALADAVVTAHLLIRIQQDLRDRYADLQAAPHVPHELLTQLQRVPSSRWASCVRHARPGSAGAEPPLRQRATPSARTRAT